MKRELLVFLALCALAIAMVPRERRGVKPRVQEKSQLCEETLCGKAVLSVTEDPPNAPKVTRVFVSNPECSCAVGMECVNDEDYGSIKTYEYFCKAPGQKKSHN